MRALVSCCLFALACTGKTREPIEFPAASTGAQTPRSQRQPSYAAASASVDTTDGRGLQNTAVADSVRDWRKRNPDRHAARKANRAIRDAFESARSCRQWGETRGFVKLQVTFGVSGAVSSASIDPPFDDGAVRSCILDVVRKASIPAFDGDPIAVSKSFTLE